VFHFSTYRPTSFKHYFVPSDTEVQSVVWQWLGHSKSFKVILIGVSRNPEWIVVIMYNNIGTISSIVLCIGHSEACWQMEQMFEQTWTICWDL